MTSTPSTEKLVPFSQASDQLTVAFNDARSCGGSAATELIRMQLGTEDTSVRFLVDTDPNRGGDEVAMTCDYTITVYIADSPYYIHNADFDDFGRVDLSAFTLIRRAASRMIRRGSEVLDLLEEAGF